MFNRRELFQKFSEAIASVLPGTAVAVQAVRSEPHPLMLAVELPPEARPSEVDIARMQAQLEDAYKGCPPCPIIILRPGMHIRAVGGEVEEICSVHPYVPPYPERRTT